MISTNANGFDEQNEIIGGYFFTAPGGIPTAPKTTVCTGTSGEAGFYDSTSLQTAAMFQLAAGSKLDTLFMEEASPYGGQTAPGINMPANVAYASFPFYYVNSAGTVCQAGAGNNTQPSYPPLPAINRTPTPSDKAQQGFIVTNLTETP